MADAFVCDRCGAVETSRARVAGFHLPDRAWDIEAYEDAIDVTASGHLCEDCSRAFARWLRDDAQEGRD